jgi:hypothetical protein
MKASPVPLPPAEELRALMQYDPKTGSLIWHPKPPTTWVNRRFNTLFAGKQVGSTDSQGHVQVRIRGPLRQVHRVIWKMMTGNEPPPMLDHKDGNPSNNKWTNIREATPQTNNWNSLARSESSTGHRCIYALKPKNPTSYQFRVIMKVSGRDTHFGNFHTIEDAKAAYRAAFIKHRGASWLR